MVDGRVRAGVVCAFALAGCRPSLDVAAKAAHDFDDRSRASAIAHLEEDHSLSHFEPPLRSIPAADVNAADARDPALRGCLFDVGGETAFDEASCGVTGANDRERRYYRNEKKVVIVRVVAVVEDEAIYTDDKCLQSGLSGGIPKPTAAPLDPNEPPPVVAWRQLRMLGSLGPADVSMRDVRYPIHLVAKVCTGTYETLGYPP